MTRDIAYEVWQELKRHIAAEDRAEAADSFINVLIDNDYSADQIREALKGDQNIKRALQSFIDEAIDDVDEEEDLYLYDDE